MASIFAVSDDLQTLQFMKQVLSDNGHEVQTATSVRELAGYQTQFNADLVIFDAEYQQTASSRLCREIRDVPGLGFTPLLLLGHYTTPGEVAFLLDSGADDVLKKPFAVRELLARVRVLLRWTERHEHEQLPRIRLDESQYVVYVDQRQVRLTPVEFQLIEYLCQNRSRYHTAVDLLHDLWNYPPQTGDTALVRNHIRNLRCKLEADPDHPNVLVSQYGRGYKIQAIVQEVERVQA